MIEQIIFLCLDVSSDTAPMTSEQAQVFDLKMNYPG